MGKNIFFKYINYNDVLENTGMFRFAAIEILSPHAWTPYMESCRKLVSPAKHKSLIQIETVRKELHVIGNWFQLKTGEHHGG